MNKNIKKILVFSLLITAISGITTKCCEQKIITIERLNFSQLDTPEKYNEQVSSRGNQLMTIVTCDKCHATCSGPLKYTYFSMLAHRQEEHLTCSCNIVQVSQIMAKTCVSCRTNIKMKLEKFLTQNNNKLPSDSSLFINFCLNPESNYLTSPKKLSNQKPRSFECIETYEKFRSFCVELDPARAETDVSITCDVCNFLVAGQLRYVYNTLIKHRKMNHLICRCNTKHPTSDEAFDCKICKPKPKTKRL